MLDGRTGKTESKILSSGYFYDSDRNRESNRDILLYYYKI